MPGRKFFTVIRPGHYPDRLPVQEKRKRKGCHVTTATKGLHRATSTQLEKQLKYGNMSVSTEKQNYKKKSKFRVKMQQCSLVIADDRGLCGNCHLEFDQIRTHLRKCHPRLYRRVILALRRTRPIAEVDPTCRGDVRGDSPNEARAGNMRS